MLTFHSLDSENNKILYHTEYKKEGNTYIFPDKTQKNTMIYLTINENEIQLIRKGNISMNLGLSMENFMEGNYKNDMGLEFVFYTKTKHIFISEKRIEMEYSLFVEDDEIATHKIWVLFH